MFLRLLFLDMKRMFKILPKIILGAFVIIIVILSMIFCLSNIKYKDNFSSKVPIALSIPENDKKAKLMINVIKEMDTIKNSVKFINMDKEKALDSVKKGEAFAAIIIPKGFTDGIINGDNIPAKIVLPKNSSFESTIVKTLTDSGAKTLSLAQAVIYSMTDFFYDNNMKYNIKQVESELNKELINFTLPRSDYFKHESIDIRGGLTMFENYTASGLSFFVFLSLLSCISILNGHTCSLNKKLLMYGINKNKLNLIKIICTSVPLMLMLFICYILFCIWFKENFSFYSFIIFPVISVTVSSFGTFVFSFILNDFIAGMIIFLSSVFMFFISGGFLPQSFLPEFLNKISKILPSTAVMNIMGNLFSSHEIFMNIFICIIVSLALYSFSLTSEKG